MGHEPPESGIREQPFEQARMDSRNRRSKLNRQLRSGTEGYSRVLAATAVLSVILLLLGCGARNLSKATARDIIRPVFPMNTVFPCQ